MTLPDTLPARLVNRADRTPQAVALRVKELGVWREIPWEEYRDLVHAAARALWELGLRPGDPVGILSDNRPEWLFADLGAQAIGARSVGIYQTNPPEDVAYVLNHAACRVLFCEDQEQVDKAIAVAADTPSVEHVVVFDPRGTNDEDDPRLQTWREFLAPALSLAAAEPGWLPARLAERDPGAPAMVIYTSGTTGAPKGALLSSRNACAVADPLVSLLAVTERDQILSYLPLCHVAEKIFSEFLPLAAGCVVHFGESIETIREDLREVQPTIFLGVPRIWEKMHASVELKMQDASPLKRWLFRRSLRAGARCAPRERDGTRSFADRWQRGAADRLVFRALRERLGLRRCRLPVTGAAPISADLLEWLWSVGVPVTEGYGMTECAGVSHLNPPGAVRIGTVGPPIPGVEQRIATDGEIVVRGPNVFVGYGRDPAATAESLDEEGWLHTGDVGELDADGYLRITGRKKEILITAGGKNLSPEKIENALKLSPYIKEAVAIGDRRKFVSALVQADADAVGDWAARRGLAYTSYEDLTGRPEVAALIRDEIAAANERLARVEQVRAFRLFPKELHQDDGELTPTQKVRRKSVLHIWEELVESMYGGHD